MQNRGEWPFDSLHETKAYGVETN